MTHFFALLTKENNFKDARNRNTIGICTFENIFKNHNKSECKLVN